MSSLLQHPVKAATRPLARHSHWLVILGVVLIVHLLILLSWSCRRKQPPEQAGPVASVEAPAAVATHALPPIREAPVHFPKGSYLPHARETEVSGSIDMSTFSPGRDLIFIEDARVWWESDNDKNADDECDHTIHQKMEIPLRRVIDAVVARQAVLKVQDTYRPTGVHCKRSLHREGRAVDLTCKGLSLEELAKICWQAGFDWVLYENPKGGGDHIHASVCR